MTKAKTAIGYTSSRNNPLRRSVITVRVTSNEMGKSLSLENGTIMLQIPIEPVADILKWVLEDGIDQ